MIVGMDFGTTNSGMAVYDGETINVLPIDPSAANPRVAPTALYVTSNQRVHIGRTAVDQYFHQNIGRAMQLKKVWIGELEVYAEEMYYVADAYAWVDVLSPGRLFLSMKTGLRDESYAGTVVGQNYYALENLAALYISVAKMRAERLLGRKLRSVVLGRPVHFAHDPEHDKLAESRLLQAAFLAGYEEVYFQYEPIAAAFSYETTLKSEQNVLIFDFGGGTLDITVMRLGDPARREALATGGIPVAGDVFDQKLTRAKLPPHFGEGSYHGPRHKQLTVPQWIYDSFSDWQSMLELQSPGNKKILQDIARTAQRRFQIEALINLVSGSYGLKMFDVVERAKRRLSDKRGAEILLEGDGFQVRDFVTRREFEAIIRAEIRAIDLHLDEVVTASGLKAGEIDAVIRTGGSAQIPVFYEMLARKFGAEKVQSMDAFSGVTAGLGIIAHGVETGEVQLQKWTPEMLTLPKVDERRKPNVPPINLEIMQKRLEIEEQAEPSPRTPAGKALLAWGWNNELLALEEAQVDAMYERFAVRGALAAGWDETLLLITNKYRFLLITPRRLAEMADAGLQLTDVHKLESLEVVCAAVSWDAVLTKPKLLFLTSLGYARAYAVATLKTAVEAPIPLKFDHPPLGETVTAVGAADADSFVMVTASGKGVRWGVKALRVGGVQAVNCHKDRVTAAVLAQPEDQLLLVTEDGYGRRLPAEWAAVPPKANSKGKSLIARRSDTAVVVNLSATPSPRLLTSARAMGVGKEEYGRLPLQTSSKTESLLKLETDELVRSVITEAADE